jgi:hypothetical protein
MTATHLKNLIKRWKLAGNTERKRIEAYIGEWATEKQKKHFLDMTQPEAKP